jgi:c(7)-type cytochrome triheme protein
MEPTMISRITKLLLLAMVLCAGAASAGDLPNLPGAKKLPQSSDSPGVVTFNHDMHVDTAKPSCLSCHAGRFSILGKSAEKPAKAITHADMEKGESCGACHGKQAFNFEDCTMCHAM